LAQGPGVPQPSGVTAMFCLVLSAVAVPLLTYFGLLCQQGSRMIQIPEAHKPGAANGCFIAAGMYAVVFVVSFFGPRGGAYVDC